MAVAVSEFEGYPQYSFDNGEFVITRKVSLAWSDVDAYAQELWPVSALVQPKSGAAYPANTRFRVSSFSIVPHPDNRVVGVSGGVNQYDLAVAEISYTVPKYETEESYQGTSYDPKPLLSHSFDSGGITIGMVNTGLKWDCDDDRMLDDNAKFYLFQPNTDHQITWQNVVNPNWEALETRKGFVNDSPFTLRGFPYPTDCLLYLGYSGSEDVMTDGTRSWSLTLKFSSKVVSPAFRCQSADWVSTNDDGSTHYGGHNYIFREIPPESASFTSEVGWYPVVSKPGGKKLYQSFDMNELFQAPSS